MTIWGGDNENEVYRACCFRAAARLAVEYNSRVRSLHGQHLVRGGVTGGLNDFTTAPISSNRSEQYTTLRVSGGAGMPFSLELQ